MNAGTLKPMTADSGYGTGSIPGSSKERAGQKSSASFMDVFARNLQHGAKASESKASAGKQKEPSGSKNANEENAVDSQNAAVAQGKPEKAETGRKADEGKAENMVTEEGKEAQENTQSHPDSGLNLEGAMELQAMMALRQNGITDIQPEEQQVQQAVVQSVQTAQPCNQEQAMESLAESAPGTESRNMAADQSLVQNAVSGMNHENAQAPDIRKEMDGNRAFSSSVKEAQADSPSVRVEIPEQTNAQTQQSGEEELTDTQGRQNLFRTMGREQTPAADEEPKEANQVLEELKRGAEAKGLDFTDKMAHNRMNGALGIKESVKEMNTPVLEQLRTGLEHNVKAGMKEFTIRLKPEGLGDIVVHLANAGEKMTVRIGVTNPDTEKLVTSQMESLKDMLRPLNAEVAEVYRDSQSAMDFAGFNQQMQQRRGQQAQTHYRYYGDEGNGTSEDDFLMEAERMMAESRMSRLYAYV